MMNLKQHWQKFLQKQKEKSLASKIMDSITIVLLVLLLIPYTRTAIKTKVTRLTMGTPKPAYVQDTLALTPDKNLWYVQPIEDGENVFLHDLQGKLVFINFWATWCPPCRAEMPDIQNFYNRFKDDVVFLFISNEEEEKIRTYLNENGYSIPVYQYVLAPPPALSHRSIPTSFLIGPKGEIILKKEGAADWDSEEFFAYVQSLIQQNKQL